MKNAIVRLDIGELFWDKKKNKGKHFISRQRFLRSLDGFDKDIQTECLRCLGNRSKVIFSVAQAILREASASVQRKSAKTLTGLTPLRFKTTSGFF